jgi:hypothetical protein
MRNRARALEILVNSPGKAGEKPCSLIFSSSTSAGYSVVISQSRSSIGMPVEAEANLDNVSSLNQSQLRMTGRYAYLSRAYWHQKTFFRDSASKGDRGCDLCA